MYNTVKNVISNKGYDLKDMVYKIETLWVKGRLTELQKDELIALARDNANMQDSISVIEKLEEIDRRIADLEARLDNMDNSNTDTEETVEEYVVGKWYYNGDKILFDGKVYTCIAPAEQVCSWSPAEYPAYWVMEE